MKTQFNIRWSAAIATMMLTFGSPAEAMDLKLQHSVVQTHRSQGEVKQVHGGVATLVRSEDGVFVNVETNQLTPGHAYTMWIVAINDSHQCSASPCPSEDVLGKPDLVKADLGFADGAIADQQGRAQFAAFQPVGKLAKAWFGTGLVHPKAEIHLVLRDHGPLQLGLERPMLTSFRAGCSAESVPETLPETARNDGYQGYYDCFNLQTVIFLPAPDLKKS